MAMTNGTPDLETILNDLAALKKDMASLAENAARGAAQATGDAVSGAAAQASESATRAYEAMCSQGGRAAKAMARHVEEQPVTSLLLAFGLGVLGSQLLNRRGS
jgi:ElaB/YqjD/DUF883 family membrane-anchored ribosome-binding protein